MLDGVGVAAVGDGFADAGADGDEDAADGFGEAGPVGLAPPAAAAFNAFCNRSCASPYAFQSPRLIAA